MDNIKDKIDIDELSEILLKGSILMFEILEERHNAEPIISMTAKTSRGEYTVKITREKKSDENDR